MEQNRIENTIFIIKIFNKKKKKKIELNNNITKMIKERYISKE